MKINMHDLYCLSNFIDYSLPIHEPLKHSNRIKYTCFDISENYVIFGATSGSLYLFNRCSGKFLHLIPNKHGPINHLAISVNEKYVAFSTNRSICVYAVNLSAQVAPQVIYTNLSSDQSVQVTCLHWTHDEKQFYYGDSRGQVNLVLLSSFMGHSLLNMTIHTILFLESPIIQIDDFESLLLVSNCSKCILCNTEYEEYKQIGNRTRDGAYGSCFAVSNNEAIQPSRIYCARPGSRFWEVDFEGDVIQTHQFKTALAIPPVKIHKVSESEIETIAKYEENDEMLDYQPQNLQFGKVQMLNQDFLLAYTELGLYVFDMRKSSIVLWCNQFERIVDCRVVNDDIVVFTQTGSLYSVRVLLMTQYVCELVRQEKLLECACCMRKNVKYFADKAREDYDMNVLNQIKNFLIDRQEYELLNDLSVIFDAIAQCEGNGDNNSSGGSSCTAERSISLGATAMHNKISKEQTTHGIYVLENAFCDNLKSQKSTEKPLKDALLTVTGKFGKNIIKYKFNVFSEEQQKLVHELIPTNERVLPFKDIRALCENDEEIVCRMKRNNSDTNTKNFNGQHISAEEKTIYNLYLICKSAKISNTNFVERYRDLFDSIGSARDLISLLDKLEQVMREHGDSELQAKKSCYEMYFNYLNAELIWEMDDFTRDYIRNGFILLNASNDIVRCDNCNFPLRFDNSCLYHDIGAVLLRYYWSRNEQVKCFDVLTQVPALFDILARFYLAENNLDKILSIVLNYGQPQLLQDIGKNFSLYAWARCFEQFVELQQGRLSCVNCECVTPVENVNRHFFYTWNCFLGIALDYLEAHDILTLILKWSNCIPNDAIDREFYTRCLLKA
ncbi:Hermansky-Pudlak syndrome 5 protein homolog [Teleopsis dalmanni]|uniref:Hermansky-Pudlak syndrome 5 protein homolog n=1 Tax=Teleopsis dalmanni TaxID=139649 RepID=UPI0018CD98DF|nr:Hermansky-Pudlak syndrome 5 protein homolog [Teleopsis dalmanni]